MRGKQNKAWRTVKSLASPMLATVKTLGSVPMAELLVSKTLSESQDKYHVLQLLVSVHAIILHCIVCQMHMTCRGKQSLDCPSQVRCQAML